MIRREGTRVWIDLDEFYPPPHGHPNTVFKSMAIAFQAAGSDVTYVDLMGISGAAFRIQVGDRFCPSSPHPHLGFSCDSLAQQALGYRFVELACEADDATGKEAARRAVVASIDRGRPVLMDEEETGLVVGYTGGGEGLLVREPYSNRGDAPVPLREWPWGFALVEKPPQKPSRQGILQSLHVALRMAHTQQRLQHGYACGFAAYERWISELLDDSMAVTLRHDAEAVVLGNAHIYYCLVDARRCASQYLQTAQAELSREARPHLLRAAALYEEIAAKLDTGWDNVPWPRQLRVNSHWTAQQRRNQASLLKEALLLEHQAVAAIEESVTLLT